VRWLRRAFGRGERSRGSRDATLGRALVRALEHDLAGSEALLADLVREDSDDVEAYLALARLYRAQGEIGRAIRIHQNLLLRRDLDEERRVEALSGLAGDFQQGGFLRRAIAAWEELVARRPRDAVALRALVRLHADAREFPRALELQRRLAKLEKSGRAAARAARAALCLEQADALRAEGRADEARRALRQAVRLEPGSAEAWIRFGEIEAERGKSRAALDAWRRVPGLDRRAAARVYPKLAATYALLGRARDYEVWLRALIEAHPEDAAARLALARALAARGEVDEAAAQARRVLERDPEHVEAMATLGRALLAEPREAEALKAFAELLDALERQGLLEVRERSS
jgi:lipopolysaccharide biosynthesis regulator YciM